MPVPERRALRKMVDHETALRAEAGRFLAVSGENLAACCRRLGGKPAEEAVRTWAALAPSGASAEWPVAEALDVIEAGVRAGDLSAARLVAPLRRLRRGVGRLDTLAWLARDPRQREEAA